MAYAMGELYRFKVFGYKIWAGHFKMQANASQKHRRVPLLSCFDEGHRLVCACSGSFAALEHSNTKEQLQISLGRPILHQHPKVFTAHPEGRINMIAEDT
eukprot:4818031-Amphidinium_carterae.1